MGPSFHAAPFWNHTVPHEFSIKGSGKIGVTTKIKFVPKFSQINYFRIEHSVDNNHISVLKSREFFEMVFGKVRSASLFML